MVILFLCCVSATRPKKTKSSGGGGGGSGSSGESIFQAPSDRIVSLYLCSCGSRGEVSLHSLKWAKRCYKTTIHVHVLCNL